jgi:PKD repeat protein
MLWQAHSDAPKGAGHSARQVRALLLPVALVIGITFGVFAPLVIPTFAGGSVATARACGLLTPQTMLADKAASIVHPVLPSQPLDTPVGIFPLNYVAGQPIAFGEDLSRVAGVDPKTFKLRWDFGDGTPLVYVSTPSHTFARPGTYNVRLANFDDTQQDWNPDFDSAQITVVASEPGNPPVAKITASAPSVALAGTVSFDAAGSHSQDGSPLTYTWNFNDGATATGAHVSHAFVLTGSSFVTLIATDGRGARSVATASIVVAPELPSVFVTASDSAVPAGGTITFDASRSTPPSQPQGDTLVKYVWDFGDGTPQATTSQPITTHTYAKAGDYTVTAEAFDKAGVPGTDTVQISVTAIQTSVAAQGPSPLFLGLLGVLAAGLIAAGYVVVQGQRRRNALIQQRQAAMQLARARHVPPGRMDPRRQPPPGAPRRGPPTTGSQGGTRGAPPPRRTMPSRPSDGPRGPRRDRGE